MIHPLIVIVDEPSQSLYTKESILLRKERSVTMARSGNHAIELIAAEHPRLVVFGFELNDMTGPEFCRIVRGSDHTRSTSLLYIGDASSPENADLCIAGGCNDFLLRPYLSSDLDDKVSKLVTVPIRKQLRTLVRMQVSMNSNGRPLLGHSLNVSCSGMLVESDDLLTPSSLVKLTFYLGADAHAMRTDAQLVRAEFAGSRPRYGFQFVGLPEVDQQRLNHFVQRLRSREAL
jgi:CheY-like chemotaxis protein